MDSQPDSDIQIAGYRIEARVGRGGMGEVYRAVQLNLGRRVALKILAPNLAADDRFRRRFLRESRIAASIDHPSIIPIYETGEDGDLLYIAMRYVDGPDLATVLRREGRLKPARTLAIMTQVASALDAAHERGLVHRDVKPANILLATGPAGTPSHCYLCDFGLIKQVDSEQVASALTATDQFVGTIPYVAPEQIEGKGLDGRTDVYSLGCVLFHCLTGSVPFQGTNDVEVVFAHLGKPPPSLSARNPALPPSMDAVITRALAKSKEDRWPTCTALVAALTAETASHPSRPPLDDAATRSMVRPPAGGPGRAPGATEAAGAAAAAGAGAAAEAPGPAGASGVAGSAGASVVPGVEQVPDQATSRGEATDPAAATQAFNPSDAEANPPPAPPLARAAGKPVSARPPSDPPEGERSRLGGAVPGAVHRPRPADRGPGGAYGGGPGEGRTVVDREGGSSPVVVRKGRRGRRWLTLVAAVVLPVAAYVAAVEVFSGAEDPQVAAAPTTVRQATATCRWSRPEVGTPARSAPLAAIRAHMGWTDRFVVDEMRSWTGSDGHWRWYVKAHQQTDPSRRGRWLVGQQEDGQRLVLASAGFTTKGYSARDWRPADGQRAQLAGLAACLAGT